MKLQRQYDLLQIAFYFVGCFGTGFTTVYLLESGVSNTGIGIVMSCACVFSMILGPRLSALIIKHEKLTVNGMIMLLYVLMTVIYLGTGLLKLPVPLVMICFILFLSVHGCITPLISVIAGGYAQMGSPVNYGLAKGLGSVSWAITSAVTGRVVDRLGPGILPPLFALSSLLIFFLLWKMPQTKGIPPGERSGSVFHVIKTYRVFFLLVLGFSLCYAGHNAIGTYLPNIITNLGGSTATFGTALFINAAIELPFLIMADRWMKRLGAANLCLIAAGAYIIRNVTIAAAGSVPVVFLGLLFQGMSNGLLTVLMANYVIAYLLPRDQIMGQTAVGIFVSGAGAMVGNLLGGWLQDNFGLQAMLVFAVVSTLLGALVFVLAKVRDMKKPDSIGV